MTARSKRLYEVEAIPCHYAKYEGVLPCDADHTFAYELIGTVGWRHVGRCNACLRDGSFLDIERARKVRD